jgi:hypothetical protein
MAATMAAMNTSKPLQIFKPGKHTAMSGASLAFSETDLAATAAAYDPAKHDAPLVVGHPKHDDPAYGWVGKLSFADGALEAEPVQVDAAFAELVAAGKFKKISASFYSPDSPNNPVPGVFYLRHVGFLGAQPPAVKGLRNPSFADSERGIVEFSEWDDVDNAGLWRSLREWFIVKFGLDEADKVIPGYRVNSLEQGAQDELREAQQEQNAVAGAAASFTEGDEMSAEEKARLAELEAENTTLKAQQVEFAEAEKKRKSEARHAEHIAFAEQLINGGKLLPIHKDVTVAMLDNLTGQDSVVQFGEGDATKPLVDAYKAQLLSAPKVVEFSEVGGPESSASATVDFAATPKSAVMSTPGAPPAAPSTPSVPR